ncbi:hypothetical protein HMPREF2137_04340 [Hoylesella buccalis DNF00853]|uniref:Uncharacterized protein n=1 Tax=Hoylesella buccalis DNF00853 TaxID=1401074 RepID=A0A095ZMJ6_9BACT|nr:hypothetical protein HMPREF2137_04340 [Hoylesella buccalis DNF00853]
MSRRFASSNKFHRDPICGAFFFFPFLALSAKMTIKSLLQNVEIEKMDRQLHCYYRLPNKKNVRSVKKALYCEGKLHAFLLLYI